MSKGRADMGASREFLVGTQTSKDGRENAIINYMAQDRPHLAVTARILP